MVEVERPSVLDLSPLVPPSTAPAPAKTSGPSSTSQQAYEHIHVTSRDLSAIMDVFRSLATTQTILAEWMALAEVTLAQNQAILL